MLKNKWNEAVSLIKNLSKGDATFLVFAMLCGFCITADYSITKPVVQSCFISAYGVKLFPAAWLVTMPINLLLVTLYNRLLPRLGCFKMLGSILGFGALLKLWAIFDGGASASFSFALYVWKDIYVLLLFQNLWSVIHANMTSDKSKLLYGIIFGVGGLGSVLGSIVPGVFAVKTGSLPLLYVSMVFSLLLLINYHFLLRKGTLDQAKLEIPSHKLSKGGALIKRSRPLQMILMIVIFMQLSSTLTEYLFNTHVAQQITDLDLRTAYYGKVFSLVNTLSVMLQFFGSFLIVQLLGLRLSHTLLPLIFACNGLGCMLVPSFGMVATAFATIKSCDYSLFGIIKEMLYVPLKLEAKFKAKAVIDVFAYRSAKAIASFFVLGLQFLVPSHLSYALSFSAFLIFVIWSICVSSMFKSHETVGVNE